MPKLKAIENINSPKELLKNLLVDASGASGKKLKKVRQSFGRHRRVLLERLDIDGPIRQLKSWKKLEDDVKSMIDYLIVHQ